jgi:hypothetical protein
MINYFVPFTKYWEYYDDLIKLARWKKNKTHVGEAKNVKNTILVWIRQRKETNCILFKVWLKLPT